jgi:oxalate decarboxylase/phosphoglucose isomerase-like protein (cupin superfamily)
MVDTAHRNREAEKMHSPNTNSNLSDPSLNLFYDLIDATFFKQNEKNVIYELTANQLPVLQNLALLDIYLSKGHIVEPHWHPNSAELVYVIRGEVIVSILNPFSLQVLTYRAKPSQVVYVPMGWWHWEMAATDHTHLLAIFDNASPQVVFGSDVLRKTPKEVFQLSYGVNAEQLAQVLKPITETVVIGPPSARPAKSDSNGNGEISSRSIKWRIGNNQPFREYRNP